jgi:hypothetical protein
MPHSLTLSLLLALLAPFTQASAAPTAILSLPAPTATPSVPAPAATLAPEPPMVPGVLHGTPAPAPTPKEELPHYVLLPPLEQAQVDRLLSELVQADNLIERGRLASAKALLDKAGKEADVADRQLLVLRLYPAWNEPRGRQQTLVKKVLESWAKGPDAESRWLVAAATKRVEMLLLPLEKNAKHVGSAQVDRQIRALRAALEAEGHAPLLQSNPAWRQASLSLLARIEHLEQFASMRAGQSLLADQIVRMVELEGDARAKLAAQDYEGTLGDYAALEEACIAFKQDLASLVARGFDPKAIQFQGVDGARSGRTFITQVDHWLLDAQHREWLVAEARDPWRKVLTGDRLRIYGMYGTPTWPGAPGEPDVTLAASQDVWVFYEAAPQEPKVRLRHEYRFVGDHLQHHELYREALP